MSVVKIFLVYLSLIRILFTLQYIPAEKVWSGNYKETGIFMANITNRFVKILRYNFKIISPTLLY